MAGRRWRVDDAIDAIGHIPLPPYIKRRRHAAIASDTRPCIARARGSVAAPTAGLHFTPRDPPALAARGVERTAITLHVGYGTFEPIRDRRGRGAPDGAEPFEIPDRRGEAIERARASGRRIVAVGTTTTRTLEARRADDDGRVAPAQATRISSSTPGFGFQVVGALMTNFHLPQSSLLMLVSAFAGRELRAARVSAKPSRERYRFYSYGDAMLIT